MRKVFVVAGLGFGDEGKGTVTEYLAHVHDAKAVVRYSGGPQAAHHIVSPDGTVHCFAQFGSATFSGAETFLTQHMVVDPLRLLDEAATLERKGIVNPLQRMNIDQRCTVVTPLHMIINRMREIVRGDARHGSCGIGVGEAILDRNNLGTHMLTVADLGSKDALKEKLHFLWRIKLDVADQLLAMSPTDASLKALHEKISNLEYLSAIAQELFAFGKHADVLVAEDVCSQAPQSSDVSVFEGSQGTLLDVDWGFAPYVTKSSVTPSNAQKLVAHHYADADVVKIGVLRAYATRHGAGPFVSEDATLTAQLPDMHNGINQWQQTFRVGWFDLVAARYALEVVGGVDQIALTNIDRLKSLPSVNVCNAYRLEQSIDAQEFDQYFEGELHGGTGIIHRIKKTDASSRPHQARLAQLLFTCRPCYRKIGAVHSLSTQEQYIQFIERELGVPITIVSRGPTRADKYQR